MKQNKKLLSALLVVSTLLASVATMTLLTSCSCKMIHKGVALDKIVGNWHITHINGETVNSEEPVTLNFDAKEMRLNGKAICNIYGAAFTIKNSGEIKVEDVFSTLVGCPGNAFETQYYSLLESVTYINVKGQEAFLYQNKKDKKPVITLHR